MNLIQYIDINNIYVMTTIRKTKTNLTINTIDNLNKQSVLFAQSLINGTFSLEYLEYINDQEETLEEIETVKAEFIKEHFDVKNDTTIQTFDTVEETNDTTDTHLNI